jgi:hypothetical protein
LRIDPARFGGVFVARLDSSRLTPLATDRRLKLKGPVIVSEATLQPPKASLPRRAVDLVRWQFAELVVAARAASSAVPAKVQL